MKTKHYLSTVRNTLMAEWKQDTPLPGNDLDAAIKLLAKLALKSSEPDAFVTKNAYTFKKMCRSGFPFASSNHKQTKIALKSTLEGGRSILFHYLTSNDNWMDEQKLDSLLQLQKLQIDEIATACNLLQNLYLEKNDFRAGYYFLWLLKKASGCTFEIPEKHSFDRFSVAKVLNAFFESSGKLKNPGQFIEILFFRSSRMEKPSFTQFLTPSHQSVFLNFAIQYFTSMPMADWPNKDKLLLVLMEIVEAQYRLNIANALASSQDPKTAQVGFHFAQARQASDLNQALPHLHALTELLTQFNFSDAEIIFQLPFPPLLGNSAHFSDPQFTKRLDESLKRVMVHDSMIIGRYSCSWNFPQRPTYLLAYNLDTEKLIWGIQLHKDYELTPHGEHLALQLQGENRLQLLDPKTGATISTTAFPKLEKGCDDCRQHLGPNGFAYQVAYKGIKGTLSIGRIQEDQWIPTSQQITPPGEFVPLSTHCGILQDWENKLIVIGPTGDQITLDHCLAAEAHKDKLYTIEKDPGNQNKCLLRVRRLHPNHDVLSTVESSIAIQAKKAAFGKFCPNEQLILFANERPLFINLKSQEITLSDHRIDNIAEKLVDTQSCAVWSWDPLSHEIWKDTSSESTLMGSLQGGSYLRLIHADPTGDLYFSYGSRS